MTLKPIETTWRGIRYRSRTEARWAVFLTTAEIAFEYEKEGYALPSGPYLPDFWLPERKHWLEIKGQEPTDREKRLARELATATESSVFFGIGIPDPDNYDLLYVWPGDDGSEGQMVSRLEGPRGAYDAARAERFDGKPNPVTKPKPMRWW